MTPTSRLETGIDIAGWTLLAVLIPVLAWVNHQPTDPHTAASTTIAAQQPATLTDCLQLVAPYGTAGVHACTMEFPK